ncbi:MAG: Zn-ribbon domain-containing OB-fold protein [Candidatus Hodarchaeota archaeon]
MTRTTDEKVLKEKKYPSNWDLWSLKGDWTIIGHQIIQGIRGPHFDKLTTQQYMIAQRPHSTVYHHSYGLISKFFQGLLEKKLYGTRCPKCGLVYCPPRAHCWRRECKLEETEWIELPLHGTVITYSLLAFAATAFLKQLPFILTYIRVDGTNASIPIRLTGIQPEEVNIGLKVNLYFIDEPKGDLMDIYATPAEKPVPPKRTPEELKRLKEDMERVRKWVQRKFH